MINIRDTFIKLTSMTYPSGTEDDVIKLLSEFKFKKDNFDNYYIIVERDNGEKLDTMFTCHLDTYGKYYDKKVDVVHRFDGDFIKTDSMSILGADDKAGMTIMLNMISHGVPGLYYFFVGEETGRIGSGYLSLNFNHFLLINDIKINKCVSSDRREYDKITTKQSNKICCSDQFAQELCDKLNEYGFWYKIDNNGGRTDSHEFVDIIPECTNISVGYFNEHTYNEKQDIEFLEFLSAVCVDLNWDELGIYRNIDKNTTDVDHYTDNDNFDIYATTEINYNRIKNDYDDDFDFDKWYNEQKDKKITLHI